MDTRSLYLKYRPEVFADVIGQDHVVSVLTRSLEEDKLAHAYLFYGGRGTGKTSVARILAKSLGVSANDLYEIDAASNNSVEDIRVLRENISTLPFEGNYKMYILDEVHMLSKAAFNALLKTLEEPPSHVIFILATTELEKVPDTIASRCQVFTFKKPTEIILAKLAENIAKKEGFLLGSGVSELVAILGDGSFRDTQGILQKVLTYSKDKNISLQEVEKVTGAPSKTLVHEYISAIVLRDLPKGLSAVSNVSKNAIDSRVFMKLVLHTFRTVLLLRVSPNLEPMLRERVSESDIELARELIANGGKMITSKTLQILLSAYSQTRHSAISEIPLELALIEIVGE